MKETPNIAVFVFYTRFFSSKSRIYIGINSMCSHKTQLMAKHIMVTSGVTITTITATIGYLENY